MPFILIAGTFHAKGYSPDGDSLKFKAKRKANWRKLDGPRPRLNSRDHVQLRFEAIDALETHYKGTHQPHELAQAATDFTLKEANITNVEWGPSHRRVSSADDVTPGYILTRQAEKYGRPVAFVFAGKPPKKDGSSVFLDATWIHQSINYKLAAKGLAYPTFYEGLFYDLRDTFSKAVQSARRGRRGVWKVDKSKGVTINNLEAITDKHPIMPKLFRRIYAHVKEHGSVTGFHKELAKREEKVVILPHVQFTHFDTVVKQSGKRIGLTVDMERLIFIP